MKKFKWAKPYYTGGNINVFYGELEDGTFFYGGDSTYQVYFCDANPTEEDENDEYGGFVADNPDWLEAHTTRLIGGTDECLDFYEALLHFCLDNKVEGNYGPCDLEADLTEIASLRGTNWW